MTDINQIIMDTLESYSLPNSWIKKPDGECVVWQWTYSTARDSDDEVDFEVIRCYFNVFSKSKTRAKAKELVELLKANGFIGVENRLTDYEETGYYNTNISALLYNTL